MGYNAGFELEFQPSLNEWQERITNMVQTSRKALSTIEALKSKEIGSSRESNLMKVFYDGEDELLNSSNEKLEKALAFLFEIPELLVNKMKSFAYLHENPIELYRKKLKKYHFEDFEMEIKRVKEMQRMLEDCLFMNKLNAGLFLIDVENIKVVFLINI